MLGGKLAVGIREVQNQGWLEQWRWGRGGIAALSTSGELPVEGTFMRDESVALEIMDWPKGRKWEAVKIFSSKQLRGTLATAMDRSRWDRVCSGACIVCKWGVPATACMQAVEFFHREEGGGSCNAGSWRQAVLEEITEEGYVVSSGEDLHTLEACEVRNGSWVAHTQSHVLGASTVSEWRSVEELMRRGLRWQVEATAVAAAALAKHGRYTWPVDVEPYAAAVAAALTKWEQDWGAARVQRAQDAIQAQVARKLAHLASGVEGNAEELFWVWYVAAKEGRGEIGGTVGAPQAAAAWAAFVAAQAVEALRAWRGAVDARVALVEHDAQGTAQTGEILDGPDRDDLVQAVYEQDTRLAGLLGGQVAAGKVRGHRLDLRLASAVTPAQVGLRGVTEWRMQGVGEGSCRSGARRLGHADKRRRTLRKPRTRHSGTGRCWNAWRCLCTV